MTLPGVTRAVAAGIVEYREYIGGFKEVEDLALVSGVTPPSWSRSNLRSA